MSAAGGEEEPELDRSDATPASRPSFWRLLAVGIGMLVAADLAVRFYLSGRQRSLDAELAKQYPPGTYVTAFASRQDYRFINLYTMNPERGAGEQYHYDSMGFRLDRRMLRFGAVPGHKYVWMFGGSTTQGLALNEDETIASRLNDLLEAARSEWRVLNLGQGGYTTTQELLLLTELLQAGHRPDAVLCYDGINDMPFDGDVDAVGFPDWERRTFKARLLLDVQGDETVSTLSTLTLTRWTKLDDFMGRIAGRVARRHATPAVETDRGGLTHPGTNWDVVSRRYLVNLSLIKAAADSLGVPSAFFFQPVMQYEDHFKIRVYSDYESSKLIPQMATNEYRRVDALRTPARDGMRAALGSTFHDIHDVFRGHDGETLYADPRHPNGAGARLIADKIYRELEASVLGSPPPAQPR